VGDGERSSKEFGIEDCVLFSLNFFGTALVSSNMERVLQVFTGASDFAILQLIDTH
jgi:hypothetical protein